MYHYPVNCPSFEAVRPHIKTPMDYYLSRDDAVELKFDTVLRIKNLEDDVIRAQLKLHDNKDTPQPRENLLVQLAINYEGPLLNSAQREYGDEITPEKMVTHFLNHIDLVLRKKFDRAVPPPSLSTGERAKWQSILIAQQQLPRPFP